MIPGTRDAPVGSPPRPPGSPESYPFCWKAWSVPGPVVQACLGPLEPARVWKEFLTPRPSLSTLTLSPSTWLYRSSPALLSDKLQFKLVDADRHRRAESWGGLGHPEMRDPRVWQLPQDRV